MAKGLHGPKLQQYPRVKDTLLAHPKLFQVLRPALTDSDVDTAIDAAFARCKKTKAGDDRNIASTPEELVDTCIEHLRTRYDPILGPNFVSQCDVESLFAFDAVSHEMQRHRMTIGTFYQFLILELMHLRSRVFDGSREGDVVADVETKGFERGLRLYMSVKKSSDTVGGQDVEGVINRLERIAKEEKNLTRPYLCVVCIATPTDGRLLSFKEDRKIRCKKSDIPYSLNCEVWGPGFIFPYCTGRSAREIYEKGIKRAANQLPFFSVKFRAECAKLLEKRLAELDLLGSSNRVDPGKFLKFICVEDTV